MRLLLVTGLVRFIIEPHFLSRGWLSYYWVVYIFIYSRKMSIGYMFWKYFFKCVACLLVFHNKYLLKNKACNFDDGEASSFACIDWGAHHGPGANGCRSSGFSIPALDRTRTLLEFTAAAAVLWSPQGLAVCRLVPSTPGPLLYVVRQGDHENCSLQVSS